MKEMNEHEIAALLQKYYEGETTLAEEKELKALLRHHNVSGKFKPEQLWVSDLTQEQQVEARNSLNNTLEKKFTEKEPLKRRETKGSIILAWPFRIAALLIISLGLGLAVYLAFLGRQTEWIEITAAPAETREVLLPDQSKVWLNQSSTLRYANKFEVATDRKVWLEGEAYFEVTHQPVKPFLIYAGGTITKVLGTSFNVRGYLAESTIQVDVISGKVSFSAEHSGRHSPVILQPGHGAVFSTTDASIQKFTSTNPNLLAWKTHQLVFDDAPLHEVVADLERYFQVDIQVENPRLLNCRFKGVFKKARLKEILAVMEFSLNVSASQKENTYSITGQGCL